MKGHAPEVLFVNGVVCLHRKNNIFEYVVDERTGFPTELFKGVKGKKLFVDEQYLVMKYVW